MSRRADSTRPDFADLSGRVYRLCLALLGDPETARDAAQEGLSRAWAQRRRKRAETPWWTWAAGFALRVCRETGRRKPHVGIRPGALLESRADPLGLTDPQHVELGQAVQELPDRQQEVVVLRFFIGLSTREAAATLGCPEGTVKSNLHKAVGNLRAVLRSQKKSDGLH